MMPGPGRPPVLYPPPSASASPRRVLPPAGAGTPRWSWTSPPIGLLYPAGPLIRRFPSANAPVPQISRPPRQMCLRCQHLRHLGRGPAVSVRGIWVAAPVSASPFLGRLHQQRLSKSGSACFRRVSPSGRARGNEVAPYIPAVATMCGVPPTRRLFLSPKSWEFC